MKYKLELFIYIVVHNWSFRVLLGHLFCFFLPRTIFIIISSFSVQGTLEVGSDHQGVDLIHNFDQIFNGSPFVSDLEHVCADLPLIINVGVIYFGGERDHWGFEWEVVEFETNLELSSSKWWILWTPNINIPNGVTFNNDNVVPKPKILFTIFLEVVFTYLIWQPFPKYRY